MRGNELKHDLECDIASRAILEKWKKGEWLNNFISHDIRLIPTTKNFPSPDQCFYSDKTKQKLALEFKPIRETKRGILTGYGQTLAYLKKQANSASVLVIPKYIKKNNEDFPIAEYMKEIFYEQIYNKLPVALFCFEGSQPSNVVLLCNIGKELKPKKDFKDRDFNRQYWAAWRENYPSHNYYLLKTANEEKYRGQERVDIIWKKFYFDYYCTPYNIQKTLELKKSNLNIWNDNDPYIWQKTTKNDLKSLVKEGKINKEQAIARLQWAAAFNSEERNKYWEIVKTLPKSIRPKQNKDNDFEDLKKNKRNNISHCSLWDNKTWLLLPKGKRYIKRIEEGCNQLEEMAIIMIGEGRYAELISDIQTSQKLARKESSKLFYADLKDIFMKKGIIKSNPNRAIGYTRKFLQSEKQIMFRFKVIFKNENNEYFFPKEGLRFDQKRINKLLNEYYKIYGSLNEEAA